LHRFSSSEARTLSLATGLLALGTLGRLLLAPGTSDLGWQPAPGPRVSEALAAVRDSVEAAVARETEAARPLAPGERIDVNRADEIQLRRLPGVGPARAAAIVSDRASNGPFASTEDLARVPGVGATSTARWSGMTTASGGGWTGRAQGPGALPGRPDRAIELNRAQPKELEQITGIGPVLARRIVAARERNGPFRSVDDLEEIPGIGPTLLENLRSHLRAP
jgi:competence protein ComEA